MHAVGKQASCEHCDKPNTAGHARTQYLKAGSCRPGCRLVHSASGQCVHIASVGAYGIEPALGDCSDTRAFLQYTKSRSGRRGPALACRRQSQCVIRACPSRSIVDHWITLLPPGGGPTAPPPPPIPHPPPHPTTSLQTK